MIRTILLGSAFVGLTAAIVILQPGADTLRGNSEPVEENAVTSLAHTALGAQAVAPAESAPSEAPTVSSIEQDSAAVLTALLAQPANRAPEADTPNAAAATQQSGQLGSLLSQAVSQAQDFHEGNAAKPGQSAEEQALLSMTQSVLAGLNLETVTGAPGEGLDQIIVQALREGQSDDYLDALLNEARGAGQINVPEALITSDGRIDTQTLLATLVQRSVAENPNLAQGPRPLERGVVLTEPQIYTVQPGDSLAAFSIRFYGQTFRYTAIYEANRDKLSSPDNIRIGQKLTIPVL